MLGLQKTPCTPKIPIHDTKGGGWGERFYSSSCNPRVDGLFLELIFRRGLWRGEVFEFSTKNIDFIFQEGLLPAHEELEHCFSQLSTHASSPHQNMRESEYCEALPSGELEYQDYQF